MSTLWFLAGHTINAWSGLGPPNEGYASCLTALLFAWFKPGLCVETWSKFWFCAIQSSQFMAAMSQVWKDDSGVPTVRYAAAAAVLGNKILVMGGYHARDSETWQCWSAALASVASKLDSLKIEAKKGSCEKRKSLAVHVGHAKAMQDRFLFRLLIGEEKIARHISYMQNMSWGSRLQDLKLIFYEFLMVHCVHERTSTLKTSFPGLDIPRWFGGPRFFSRRVEWFCISLSWAIFLECPRM